MAKLCIDCDHCKTGAELGWSGCHVDDYFCDGVIDLVTGSKRMILCSAMRRSGEYCGTEGRLFKPKVKAAKSSFIDADLSGGML